MISLIKNELTKIFRQKSTYILFLILAGVILLHNIININTYDKDGNRKNSYINYQNSYMEENISKMEDEISKVDKVAAKEKYLSLKTNLDLYKISQEYNKNGEEWKETYIHTTILETINSINFAEVYNLDNSELSKLERNYQEQIMVLQLDNWEKYSEILIKNYENEKKVIESTLSELDGENLANAKLQIANIDFKIKLENLRIKYDYGFDRNKWAPGYIEDFQYGGIDYLNKKVSEITNEEERIMSYNAISGANIKLKSLEDNINYGQVNTTSNMLANSAEDNVLFIMIIVVVIAGGIVSSEYSRGTIKFLLIRPYKRYKIILAKFIAVLIMLLIAMLASALIQFVLGIFFYGFDTYSQDFIIYSFSQNSVIFENTIIYTLLQYGIISVQLVLIAALAFLLSTVFKTSALAIALPIVGFTSYELINMLAQAYNLKFLKYFVSLNWNFNDFIFGKAAAMFSITLMFAAITCLVYFLVMLILAVVAFCKTDVKNQ